VSRTKDDQWRQPVTHEPTGGHAPRRSRNRRIDLEWHRHLSHHVGSRADRPTGARSRRAHRRAHASCFSMALSHGLATSGNPAISLNTSVEVDFQPGVGITEIRITAVRRSGEPRRRGLQGRRRRRQGQLPGLQGPRRGADHVERRLRTFRQNNEWGSRRRGYNALRFATLRFIERRPTRRWL